MRRDELARLGIQLPALPTIVLGGLPGAPGWAARLERLGLDVVSSGAAPDTAETWRAARAAAPHRPVKAVAGDAVVLARAGCRLVEGGEGVPGAYRIGPDESLVCAVAYGAEVDDPNDVARVVLGALESTPAAELWVAAGPGLDALEIAVVEAKLDALVEGARLARLVLAKEQFGP